MLVNKPMLYHYYKDSNSKGDKVDIRLTQFGAFQKIEAISSKAIDEFEKLIPSKIDRFKQLDNPIGRILEGSFAVMHSNDLWGKRRKLMSKILGINYCSKYIESMIEVVDSKIDHIKQSDVIVFDDFVKQVTILIICKILFGADIDKNMPMCKYIDPETYEVSYIPFNEFYPKVGNDEINIFTGVIGNMLPTLATNNLINPHKTSKINIKEVKRVMLKF